MHSGTDGEVRRISAVMARDFISTTDAPGAAAIGVTIDTAAG